MHYCALTYILFSFLLFVLSIIGNSLQRKDKDRSIVAIFLGVMMCVWAGNAGMLLIL